MVHFDVRNNIQHDAGVSQVVFGAGQEILETELNELQTLFDLKLAKLVSAIVGNAYVDGSITVENGNLVISGGFLFVGGRIAQIDRAETLIMPNSRYVLRIYERMIINEQDTLHSLGNRNGETVPNHIVDPRFNQPLSRRATWDWRLETIPYSDCINESDKIDILNPLASDEPTVDTPTVVIARSGGISKPPTLDEVIINQNGVISKATLSQLIEQLEKHNTNLQAHENQFSDIRAQMLQNFSQTMPLAPLGAVHGAIGGRWEALEGTELRAVVMVSEDVKFSFTNRYIDIPQDQFDRFEVFYITVNGAMARIEKNPMKQTLFAVGADFEHYAFVYDGENMRVEVRRLGIAASNPNILHNWWFVNPVNQRGLLEYNGVNINMIDRWRTFGNARMNVMSGFIRVSSTSESGVWQGVMQEIEHSADFTGIVTGTVMTSDGSLFVATWHVPPGRTFNSGATEISGTPFFLHLAKSSGVSNNLLFRITYAPNTLEGSHIDIQAVKLELGPVSTLANDPPMDFGRELAVCQRYQYCMPNALAQFRASRLAANEIWFKIPTPVTMRIRPAVAFVIEHSWLGVTSFPGNTVHQGFNFAFANAFGGIRVLATKQNHGLPDAHLQVSQVLFDANL